MQFDAIFELDAPLVGTDVALFARYWVSGDSYRVAVVWAEPHTGALNFPTYPPTLNIVSEPNQFALSSQFHSLYNRDFAKPIGPRDPFRDKFNAYDLTSIRFAEKEALDLRSLAREQAPAGQAHADELSLSAEDGSLLESIKSEYGGEGSDGLLRWQQAILPQRTIKVGFTGQGPSITVGGKTQQYSELDIPYHEGGRRCEIEYQPQAIGGRPVSLPSRIVVYSGDGKRILRSVRLYNYVECPADQVAAEAKRFSSLDASETTCRELLLKYWMKAPREIPQADSQVLRDLYERFSAKSTGGVSVGEQLKRINMLAEMDLMLGNGEHLAGCFGEYLAILRSNSLDTMLLTGGLSRIDITMRWNQFTAADRLLEQWLEAAAACDPQAVLTFADTQVPKGQYWVIAKLLERSLKTRDWGEDKLAGQVLRCTTLAKLREGFVKPEESLKTEQAKNQAGWVATSFGIENVTKALREDVSEAQLTFANLKEPTKQQKALKSQLDAVEKTIRKPDARQ